MSIFLRKFTSVVETATLLLVVFFLVRLYVPSNIIINLYEKWDGLQPPDISDPAMGLVPSPCISSRDCEESPPPFPPPPPSSHLLDSPHPPPSEKHDLNRIVDRMGSEAGVRAIKLLLSKKKSGSDGVGFIYIFRKPGGGTDQYVENKFKIGCTNLHVGAEKRAQQWVRHCNQSFVLQGKWKVSRHRLCEKLIHCELKAKKKWLGTVPCGCKTNKGHCEWFTGTLQDLSQVISFWVDYVNRMYGGQQLNPT